MSGVRLIQVSEDDADIRLDRWFKRQYPGLSHIRLEKLLRTGQVRVDGGRVKAATRLAAGATIRVPPLDEWAEAPLPPDDRPKAAPKPPSEAEQETLRQLVLYRDKDVIAINKPHGLAVQGGTNTSKHLDGMLDALKFDAAERPRLVHRLDKDTSGVLLLARSAKAAAWLAQAFREKSARKTYWAVVAGVPRPHRGKIDLPVGKGADGGREKMMADEDEGRWAVTYYAVVEQAAQKVAWLAMMPITGRTHQLRVHCAEIGTPILGDGKYGGGKAVLDGIDHARKLHLHARSIRLDRPDGSVLEVTAPLPAHMQATWKFFGFEPKPESDPFEDLELE
ncbi:pseudouridine synthase [Aliidongia dinghuensis]|uniref:Pseudouridine synthase n=1 Tax=Aliidongia dinghuensis TaxID=1867774 RepID=A0A8J3E6F8_9PROT|nr:RluA family pseudouridine synthase [Aliidongia dinghuensis]GGF29508.1 pseudouridine synthase [Aliidongia dinghuensis]